MTTLYSQIKAKQLEARKAKSEIHVKLFTTMLGELESSLIGTKKPIQYEKDNKTFKIEDTVVLSLIKKYIGYANQNLEAKPTDQKTILELEILESFLPKQLSDKELEDLILDIKSKCHSNLQPTAILGFVMKELKVTYAGRFNGAKVKDLVLGT